MEIASPITKNWISNNPERTQFTGHIEGVAGGLPFSWWHRNPFPTYQECWDHLTKIKVAMINLHRVGKLLDSLEGRY